MNTESFSEEHDCGREEPEDGLGTSIMLLGAVMWIVLIVIGAGAWLAIRTWIL